MSFLLSGCFAIMHTTTISNGVIKQRTCINGDCHTLYGAGTIFYDHNQGIVRVQCYGRFPTDYDPKESKGYNCIKDEEIPRKGS